MVLDEFSPDSDAVEENSLREILTICRQKPGSCRLPQEDDAPTARVYIYPWLTIAVNHCFDFDVDAHAGALAFPVGPLPCRCGVMPVG